MQRSVLVTVKGKIAALFLLCIVLFFGCGPGEKPRLYIYCNETFWYVMQEEALVFNKVYGFNISLIPIRSTRTSDTTAETLEIDGDDRAPAPWRSMPQDQTASAEKIHTQINTDIEQQIERIEKESFGDLFISDSKKHGEKLQELALSVNDFPVCYLTLTMLVPKGNPHEFRSVKNVLETNRTLGIVDPSLDGLGESSWNVLQNIVSGGESAIPMERVRIYERQYDLLEALEQGKIDAALAWNATSLANFLLVKYADAYNAENKAVIREAQKKQDYAELRVILQSMYEHLIETKSFAEEIPLSDNPGERCVVAARLVALSTTTNYGYCERFVDFMRSRQGQDIFRRFGFVGE